MRAKRPGQGRVFRLRDESQGVVSHDPLHVTRIQLLDALGVVHRLDVALGVRPVRSEEHVVGADQLGEPDDVLFGKG